nr:bifunctional riboflavin kinase/FAD synthetase [Salsipaludibacter albus]
MHHVDVAPSVVTIGVFDGVHRGHRALLDRVRDEARTRGMRAVAVTFDRHPMAVLDPAERPPALQTLDDKVASLEASGIDHVHVLTFDRTASREPAVGFATRVLGGPLAARHVVVGTNFRFGHGAVGDVALLERLGADLGFTVEGFDLVDVGQEAVSSSRIRDALARGDVAWAAEALGRPHRLSGSVVRGDGRGRTIGVPTANVSVVPGLALPAAGVYATRVRRRGPDGPTGPVWDAVTNIGTRPTFDGRDVTVEAHLLDVEVDLYDQEVVVDVLERLRDERRFDDVDALVTQIHDDIAAGRAVLGHPAPEQADETQDADVADVADVAGDPDLLARPDGPDTTDTTDGPAHEPELPDEPASPPLFRDAPAGRRRPGADAPDDRPGRP